MVTADAVLSRNRITISLVTEPGIRKRLCDEISADCPHCGDCGDYLYLQPSNPGIAPKAVSYPLLARIRLHPLALSAHRSPQRRFQPPGPETVHYRAESVAKLCDGSSQRILVCGVRHTEQLNCCEEVLATILPLT